MKRIKIIMGCILACTLLSACGNNETDKTTNQPATQTTQGAQITEAGVDTNNSSVDEVETTEKNKEESNEMNSSLPITVDVSNIKTDYVVSSGLEMKETRDGTYEITGRGTCKDEILVFSSEMDGKTVTSIAEKAFSSDEAKGVVFQDANGLNVDKRVFYYCEDLAMIQITNSNIEFDEYNFYSAGDKATLLIYNSTIKTEEHAFDGSELVDVQVISSDFEAGDRTFYYCEDLENLVIDASRVDFGEYALYSAGDDMIFSITNSVIATDEQAFSGCKMTSFTTVNCELSFDDRSFYYCEDLNEFIIDATSFEVGEYCFYGCEDLAEANICMNSTSDVNIKIGEQAFSGCESLEVVKIGNGKVDIDDRAFYYCEKLKELTIDSSEVTFGEYVFYGCPEDASITYGGNTTTAGSFK